MKTKQIIVTESGKDLVNADDGVVFGGALFKGDAQGGLLGDGVAAAELLENSVIEFKAYTNFEFFDALGLDPEVFFNYYETRKKRPRGL